MMELKPYLPYVNVQSTSTQSPLAQLSESTPYTLNHPNPPPFLLFPQTSPGNLQVQASSTSSLPVKSAEARFLIVQSSLKYFPVYQSATANSMHLQIWTTLPIICYSFQKA